MFDLINNQNKLLGDDLKKEIKQGSKVRIAASCFSMYAFNELKKELGEIEELKFLFTSPTFTKDQVSVDLKKEKREFYIPKQNRESNLYGSDFEIKLRNEMTLKVIAKECAEWVKKKVKFKSNTTTSNIPNLIGLENADKTTINYMPIDGFTTRELGYQKGNNIFTAINKNDFAEQSKFLFAMFDEVWGDKLKVQDIPDNVKEIYIIRFDLKNKTTPEKFIEAFNKQITFQVLFKFCFGAEVKYLTAIKTFDEKMNILKTYQTEWQKDLQSDFPLTTKLETIYKVMLSNITGINFRADETFEAYIERNSAIKRQNLEIDRLTRIMNAEKQPNIKMNLNDKIKQLKKELANLMAI